jgi:hypothetical protein
MTLSIYWKGVKSELDRTVIRQTTDLGKDVVRNEFRHNLVHDILPEVEVFCLAGLRGMSHPEEA